MCDDDFLDILAWGVVFLLGPVCLVAVAVWLALTLAIISLVALPVTLFLWAIQ